ncbi:hypothetical protein D3C80_776060 [compost metagenome]
MPKVLLSLDQLNRPAVRGTVFSDRSLYEAWTERAEFRPLREKSSGRPVCRSTVEPSEPSSISADWVLRTLMLLNSSDANIEKSKLRLRLPPEAAWASRPLMRVRVKSPPRPRTEMVVPWPLTRSMVTPGRRWMASARF